MFFDSEKLDECIQNRFAILDEIRDTRVGDSVSITVSVGVSRISGSLKMREAAAREIATLIMNKTK
jgi:c-di-AMP phosphodiesterase-like protein